MVKCGDLKMQTPIENKKENITVIRGSDVFSRTSIIIIIILFGTILILAFGLISDYKSLKSDISIAMEEMRSYNEAYLSEKYIYQMNPTLKLKQKEVRDIVRYTYIYSKFYDADFYDCLAIEIWESEGFKKSNADTIGSLGEIGYFQLMPSTGALLGFSVDDLKDLENNTLAGIRYLKLQMDNKGWNINKAIGSYNGGSKYYIYETAQQYIKEVAAIKNELIAYIEEHRRN